jgi:hypothetical protein
VRLVVQTVGGEEGELVRVLAHRGHAHAARVVEVHVRQLVRQSLDLQREGEHYYSLCEPTGVGISFLDCFYTKYTQ